MTINIDDAGVRVDQDGWHALLEGTAPEVELARAHEVPGVADGIAAARHPVALLEIDMVTPTGVFGQLAWVAEGAVALLIDHGGEERRLMAFAPDHLAVSLARLVGLGPRPSAPRQRHPVDEDRLERVFSDDAGVRAEAMAPEGADRAWRLSASLVEGDESSSLHLVVLDGPGGCWLVEAEGSVLHMEPVSSTFVWRCFAGLLPALG